MGTPCQFLEKRDIPCPSCGMTTAFALLMHGRPLAALVCQPFGLFVAAGCTIMMALFLVGLLSGCRIKARLSGAHWKWGLTMVFAGGVASWLYKIVVWRLGP